MITLYTDFDTFPRLMVNKRGEIILATSRSEQGLTTGILVDKLPTSISTTKIGTRYTDWEVAGELTNYNGEVDIVLENGLRFPE